MPIFQNRGRFSRRWLIAAGLALVVCCLAIALYESNHSSTGIAAELPVPKIAGLTEHSLTSGGRKRTYVLYVPPGLSPSKAVPLVLVYHGADASAVSTLDQTSLMRIAASKRNVILAFMQGYEDTWNDAAGHTPATRAGINDVTYTYAALAQIEHSHKIDMRRIAATGISNGGIMTERLGCQLAANITFVMPVEGPLAASIAPTCKPSRPISIFEVHGTSDPAIPYAGGSFPGVGGTATVLSAPGSVAEWAHLNGCRTGSPTVHTAGHFRYMQYQGCSNGVVVTLNTVIGGVHAWPSGFGQTVINLLKAHPALRAAAQA